MAPSFDAPIAGAANRPTAPATTPWTAHRHNDVDASAPACWLHAGPVSACACSGRTLPMLLRPEDTPALKSFGLRRLKTVAERSAGHRTSSSCLGCSRCPWSTRGAPTSHHPPRTVVHVNGRAICLAFRWLHDAAAERLSWDSESLLLSASVNTHPTPPRQRASCKGGLPAQVGTLRLLFMANMAA